MMNAYRTYNKYCHCMSLMTNDSFDGVNTQKENLHVTLEPGSQPPKQWESNDE